MTVNFQQAAIKIEKVQEFARLQGAIEHVFSPVQAEQFLKQMDRKGIRIRDFDSLLTQRVLEGFSDGAVDLSQLYKALPLSDQAQVRELYLSKLEGIDVALRHKFKKLYQYY